VRVEARRGRKAFPALTSPCRGPAPDAKTPECPGKHAGVAGSPADSIGRFFPVACRVKQA
jgi:hypothetical protein